MHFVLALSSDEVARRTARVRAGPPPLDGGHRVRERQRRNHGREVSMSATLEVHEGAATLRMAEEAWSEILEEIGQDGSDARVAVEALGTDPNTLAGASV